MTHDQASIREPGEKAREKIRDIRFGRKGVRPGKPSIESNAASPRLASKREAQNIKRQCLAVMKAGRSSPAALPHPGTRCTFRCHLEKRIAHLRKKMHVLVSVEKIRRPPEGINKGSQLRRDLDNKPLGLKPPHGGRAKHVGERHETFVAQ